MVNVESGEHLDGLFCW